MPVLWQRTVITAHLATRFSDLTSLTEKDIDTFVTNTGIRNWSLDNNQAVVLPDRSILNIKAVLFELHDQPQCDTIATADDLNNIDQNVLHSLRKFRQDVLKEMKAQE